jgi:hypothetical protein
VDTKDGPPGANTKDQGLGRLQRAHKGVCASLARKHTKECAAGLASAHKGVCVDTKGGSPFARTEDQGLGRLQRAHKGVAVACSAHTKECVDTPRTPFALTEDQGLGRLQRAHKGVCVDTKGGPPFALTEDRSPGGGPGSRRARRGRRPPSCT